MDSDDSDVGDLLGDLLANAETDETEKSESTKKLSELNYNFLDSDNNSNTKVKPEIQNNTSVVHEPGVDSSDDEDKRNFEEQKYSDYGRNLKSLLKNEKPPTNVRTLEKSQNPLEKLQTTLRKLPKAVEKSGFNFNTSKTEKSPVQLPQKSQDVYSDPIFGLRIVKPLISSAQLVERMNGRKAITVARVKQHIATENIHDDWVIAGVLINRSPIKTSQKGSQYCIWKLSDLGEKMYTVSLFVFSGAYKLFWKTATGTVIGILNPSVMDSKDDIDQATLSVDNAQKIMILGNSRDMGKCRSKKKNGEPCSNIVNLSRCEYCIYHVKQEYKKASRRSDIQSNTIGPGLSASIGLKPKATLGGIYSQQKYGQDFTAIVAKKNEKLIKKDSERLALLRGTASLSPFPVKTEYSETKKRKAFAVELTSNQMKKDLEKLNKLKAWNVGNQAVVGESPSASSAMNTSKLSSPRLSGIQGGTIDFSEPITKKHMDKARQNALSLIREKGGLKKSNPNKIHESKEKIIEAGAKRRRVAEIDEENVERNSKKNSINEKFKAMLEAKSSHADLVEQSQEDDKEKYFEKLEMKERMEDKMMSTFKVDCKAVKCLICKYTSYSASDLCKEQKHPLKVVNAVKSFFKCADCGNRTISLDRIPSESCKKCRGSHWVRAAMMDEKKTELTAVKLSIRGGEEKFIGSIAQDANINLLVPDSGAV